MYIRVCVEKRNRKDVETTNKSYRTINGNNKKDINIAIKYS